jgi:hypothetical protein
MKIKLSNSPLYTIVDDEDYTRVKGYTWFARISESSCAIRGWVIDHHMNLSNFIMNDETKMYDHEDLDPLNNQKINLRESSHSQNMMNRRKFKNCSSRYKGVTWHRVRNSWYAQIAINGKRKSLGYFTIEENAAKAYNKAAKEFHGEFARLNVIN